MYQNILFNFIQQQAPSGLYEYKQIPFLLSSNIAETSYYRGELPVPPAAHLSAEGKTYILTAHHISIYEKEAANNPFLSQYHYTAYFCDSMGGQYQLHVYYGDKDKVVEDPQFATREDDVWRKQSIPDLHLSFIELGNRHASPYVIDLRKELTKQVHILESQYHTINTEAETLSLCWKENYTEYSVKIDQSISILEKLAPLVREARYRQVLKLTQHIQKEMASIYQHTVISPLAKDSITREEATESKEEGSEVTAIPSSAAHVSLSYWDTTLADLEHRFTKIKQGSKPEAQPFAILFADISGHLLSLESNEDHPSVEQTVLLRQLYEEACTLGEHWFHTCLVCADLPSLNLLSFFCYLLEEKHLAFALHRRHPPLLDFLLTKGPFSVIQPITIKSQTYASLALACFDINSEITPMVDCFNVLIHHGAMGLETNVEGLPIADLILSNPSHPFFPAFTQNTATLLLSPTFFNALIKKLRDCLTLPSIDKEAILARIEKYKLWNKDSKAAYALFDKPIATAAVPLMIRAGTSLPDEWLKLLLLDTDISSKINRMKESMGAIYKTQTKKNLKQFELFFSKEINSLEELLQSCNIPFPPDASYEGARQMILSCIHNCTLLFDKLIALREIEDSLLKGEAALGKTLYKNLKQERVELEEHIDRLFQSLIPHQAPTYLDDKKVVDAIDSKASAIGGEETADLEKDVLTTLEKKYIDLLSAEEKAQYAHKQEKLWTRDMFVNEIGKHISDTSPAHALFAKITAEMIQNKRLQLINTQIMVKQAEIEVNRLNPAGFYNASKLKKLQKQIRQGKTTINRIENDPILNKSMMGNIIMDVDLRAHMEI